MIVKAIKATFSRKGVLTPDLCQVCKKGGPGVTTVWRTGRCFSAHRWPCADAVGASMNGPDLDADIRAEITRRDG